MAKILLLDFTPADRDRLVSEKYDVDVRATGWTTGRDEPLDLPGDSEVVFYQIGGEAAAVRPDLHAEVHEALTERVRAGARVVCFIGGGDAARLTNIVGPMDGIQVQDNRPDRRRRLQSQGPVPRSLSNGSSPSSPRPSGSCPRRSGRGSGRGRPPRTASSNSWPRPPTAPPWP